MLKTVRESNNLSQSQLSADSGVNFKMIQKYEQGVKNINHARLETLLKLCNSLNCTLLDLVTDPELESLVEVYETKLRSDRNGQVFYSQNM